MAENKWQRVGGGLTSGCEKVAKIRLFGPRLKILYLNLCPKKKKKSKKSTKVGQQNEHWLSRTVLYEEN